MRIRELAELSGQSKTTIHFYQREGLLPPLHKTARNAAIYGEEHLRRLALIQQLRQGGLRNAQLLRAIGLVEQGVAVETALALQQALISPQGGPALSLEELAAEAQLSLAVARQYLRAGLLGPPGRRRFQREDVAALQALAAMASEGAGIDFLRRAVGLVNELTQVEFALADRLTAELPQAERSQKLLALQDAVDCLHVFWLAQARRQQVVQRWPAALQKMIREEEL